MKTRSILATFSLGALLAVSTLVVALPASAAAATASRWVGLYVPGAPRDIAPLNSLESKVGSRARASLYYQNTTEGFTSTQARNAVSHGAIPLVTLEFWNPANGVSQPAFSYAAISRGDYDAYLRTYARAAKAFGSEVWFRPMHEMNGNWYPWCGTVNGNSPAAFVPAWRRIRDIFAAEGATNVKFVWSPNADSVPNTAANSIAAYWPGDAYVDYLALDGYNFGSTTGSSWRSFDDVFGRAYTSVTALSAKPLFIAETACSPTGGDKAAWISQMFASIPARFPRITGVTWFNTNKECDWRLESSPASLSAFVAGMAALNPAPVSPTAVPVYRFYNVGTGTHFYTASADEKISVLTNLAAVYRLEGVAYSLNTLNAANGTSLYRFYNLRSGTHFYTASAAEKDAVLASLSTVYRLEGVAYNVSTSAAGNTAVYRFYNVRSGTHFYTASIEEKNSVQANQGAIYRFEGPAFYLAP